MKQLLVRGLGVQSDLIKITIADTDKEMIFVGVTVAAQEDGAEIEKMTLMFEPSHLNYLLPKIQEVLSLVLTTPTGPTQ